MGGTATKEWGKKSWEGNKITLVFWKSETCDRAERCVQVSTLCVCRGEDRTEVLKCMTSAFSWFWSLSYHFSPLSDTLRASPNVFPLLFFLRFHFLVSLLKSTKYIKIALQLFATNLLKHKRSKNVREKHKNIFNKSPYLYPHSLDLFSFLLQTNESNM